MRELLEALGLNPLVLVAGGAGGLLRALSSTRHSLRERIVSPLCGALAAGYLTAAGVHILRSISVPLPDDPLATFGAVGFILGVSAMWLSDFVMLFVLQKLRRPV